MDNFATGLLVGFGLAITFALLLVRDVSRWIDQLEQHHRAVRDDRYVSDSSAQTTRSHF